MNHRRENIVDRIIQEIVIDDEHRITLMEKGIWILTTVQTKKDLTTKILKM